MPTKKLMKSIEPNIADLANGWLKSYKLDYKLEQESLNTEIDWALEDYYSKNGGAGGNRPDFKNINSYAVNGAVHYANALLHYTSYTDIIAIGMTGFKNDTGSIEYAIGVYYVSKSNFGIGQKVDDYTDFSFLKKNNFNQFIEKVKCLQLSQDELDKLKEQREREINASLVKLNNDIYQNENGLGESDRVYLVAASIIATLGVPGNVTALEKSELKSSPEIGNRDGDIILRKIAAFLNVKNLPQEKRELIIRTLQNTLTTDNINKAVNGESQLKRVFTKIVDDLGIYYKIGLTTSFTGRLFNEMYSWLGFSHDKLNDVVVRKITPKITIPKSSILFFTTLLNKQREKLLSVLVRDVDNTFKNTIVKLPITEQGEINFEFMESFIAELSAYLKISGLDNS